ncbi:MAG: chemotaxis protein CheW [Pseudomonadota bacterium]
MAPFDEPLKSERILRELQRRDTAKETLDVQEEQVKVVIFTSGRNRYAFYGRDIKEILPPCPISWVPGLPDYLPGLINVRGDIESVVDIRHFLGEEKTGSGDCLIALTGRVDFRSGVLIDTVEDVVDIPLSAIKPPLSTLGGAVGDMAIGELEHGGKAATLLDIGKLAAKISL